MTQVKTMRDLYRELKERRLGSQPTPETIIAAEIEAKLELKRTRAAVAERYFSNDAASWYKPVGTIRDWHDRTFGTLKAASNGES